MNMDAATMVAILAGADAAVGACASWPVDRVALE
jgi:hypothetical protein